VRQWQRRFVLLSSPRFFDLRQLEYDFLLDAEITAVRFRAHTPAQSCNEHGFGTTNSFSGKRSSVPAKRSLNLFETNNLTQIGVQPLVRHVICFACHHLPAAGEQRDAAVPATRGWPVSS